MEDVTPLQPPARAFVVQTGRNYQPLRDIRIAGRQAQLLRPRPLSREARSMLPLLPDGQVLCEPPPAYRFRARPGESFHEAPSYENPPEYEDPQSAWTDREINAQDTHREMRSGQSDMYESEAHVGERGSNIRQRRREFRRERWATPRGACGILAFLVVIGILVACALLEQGTRGPAKCDLEENTAMSCSDLDASPFCFGSPLHAFNSTWKTDHWRAFESVEGATFACKAQMDPNGQEEMASRSSHAQFISKEWIWKCQEARCIIDESGDNAAADDDGDSCEKFEGLCPRSAQAPDEERFLHWVEDDSRPARTWNRGSGGEGGSSSSVL